MREQMDCGVRYCDLRIARRPNDNSSDLYFYHGVYTTITVEVRFNGGLFASLYSTWSIVSVYD